MIVMDEEQEATYKSEMSPRYHARDVARVRDDHAAPAPEQVLDRSEKDFGLPRPGHPIEQRGLRLSRIGQFTEGPVCSLLFVREGERRGILPGRTYLIGRRRTDRRRHPERGVRAACADWDDRDG